MYNSIDEIYEYYVKNPFISTDTRNIKKNSIFFSLKGANFNGNQFAKNALELGAQIAIIDDPKFKMDDRYYLVSDVLDFLQQLANYHRKKFSIPIIAITGSNGKTTTKELVYSVLKQKYATHATTGNLNNHIGVPLTLLSMPKETQIGIIEMGANHQGEIELLCKIAEPNFGLITNIGKAHLEGFGGVEGIIKGKGELYTHLLHNSGIAFINKDSSVLLEMANKINTIEYGTIEPVSSLATITNSDPFVGFNYIRENICINIQSNLVGTYNISNLLAACTIGNYFQVSDDQIKTAIEEYFPSNNRSQIERIGTNTLILDAYNANPSSMEAAIVNFHHMELTNKTLVLGDMLELGLDSIQEHQKIIELISTLGFLKVYLIGQHFFNTDSTYKKFLKVDALIQDSEWNELSNLSVLIKGSRGIQLEKFAEFIKQKTEA